MDEDTVDDVMVEDVRVDTDTVVAVDDTDEVVSVVDVETVDVVSVLVVDVGMDMRNRVSDTRFL